MAEGLHDAVLIRGTNTVVNLSIAGSGLSGAALFAEFDCWKYGEIKQSLRYGTTAPYAGITITAQSDSAIAAQLAIEPDETRSLPESEYLKLNWALWLRDSLGNSKSIDNGICWVQTVATNVFPFQAIYSQIADVSFGREEVVL